MLRNNPGWFSWFSWFWSCWWKVPLFRAVWYGYERVVRMLIAAGADVNVVERRGHTPLHVAAFIGHEGVARVLMEGGADVRAVCFRQRTPLHVAAFRGYGGMARLLKERGADVNAVNREQCTPLHYAAERGNEGVAKVLMEEGADVRAVNAKQQTPLQLAVVNKSLCLARQLKKTAGVLVEGGAELVTCDPFSGGGGFGGAQEGQDSSGDEDNSPYENYRKTTSANKEMDMALLDNKSKVSRDALHAHYLFVYGEDYKEILKLLQKLYDPESLDVTKDIFEEEEEQEEQEDSDYLAENKSKYDELVQELLETEINLSKGSIIPFSIPVNKETVDMSGVRQDQEWFPDADVPWMEPRLDLTGGSFVASVLGGMLSGVSGEVLLDDGTMPHQVIAA